MNTLLYHPIPIYLEKKPSIYSIVKTIKRKQDKEDNLGQREDNSTDIRKQILFLKLPENYN